MGEPNAIEQILMGERFEGTMEGIRGLTEFLDDKLAWFISIIAFFIIASALLRNVIAGAYASFPKFWDKIADAKASMANKQLNLGGTDVSIFMKIFAFFIPDLKSMSDFHDDNIEPKDYFIKAIPKMVATVMIGVVIFNGYYRDAVAMTSKIGSEIIVRVLENDPVEFVNRVASTAGRKMNYATKGDESTLGKYTYKISKEIVSKFNTRFTDVKNATLLNRIAADVEAWIMEELYANQIYLDGINWDIQYNIAFVLGYRDLTSVSNGDNEDRKSIAFQKPIADLDFESKVDYENTYIKVIMRFSKIIPKEKSGEALTNLQLQIPKTAISSRTEAGLTKTLITIPAPSSRNGLIFRTGTLTIGGMLVKGSKNADNTLTLEIDGELDQSVGKVYNIESKFEYAAVNKKGNRLRHTITSIKIITGSSIIMEDINNKEVAPFDWNTSPEKTVQKED